MDKAIIFEANLHAFKVEINESALIGLLKEGNESAFEHIFKDHFKSLHHYAFTFIKDDELAEEMVQNVFCRIWEKRQALDTGGSVKAYLYRSVHNECLNYLKHQKVKSSYQNYHAGLPDQYQEPASGRLMVSELEKHLHAALNDLPQQCRTIFQMSRFENLKYREIASRLDISVKTVENQMGKALKIMRFKLIDFLPLLLLLFRLK